jgi:hypothetical protein
MNHLILPTRDNVAPVSAAPERRSVARLLAPLDQLAEQSPHFISKSLGEFDSAGCAYSLPRYVFLGPKGGGDRPARDGRGRPASDRPLC